MLLYCLFFSAQVYAQEHLHDYTFFTNSRIGGNYYSSKATFQSPSFIKNKDQRLPISETIFHTPWTALKLDYINGKNGSWKAAIFREEIRSQDHFKSIQYFSFSVYIPSANTTSKYLPAYQFILKDSSFSDKYTFEVTKINSWETITTPVSAFNGIDFKNPTEIIGVVFSQNNEDGNRHTIYIDDIEFLPSQPGSSVVATPNILTSKGYAKHIDISWQPCTDENVKYVKIYRSENGKSFVPVGIQSPLINRYSDYTGVTGKMYNYKISFLNYQYKEIKQEYVFT